MDATLVGFEDACDRLQSPATNQAAQKVLMDFLDRPASEVLEVSRAVLGAWSELPAPPPAHRTPATERSQKTLALFQAVLSMRQAVIRNWEAVAPATRDAVRSFLLSFAAARQGCASRGAAARPRQ